MAFQELQMAFAWALTAVTNLALTLPRAATFIHTNMFMAPTFYLHTHTRQSTTHLG